MVVIRLGEERLSLQAGEHDIGRGPTCRVVVDDLDVSRRHARLCITERGEVSIVDLGSRNGTIVDGQLLEGWTARPLAAGATITVGSHVLVLEPVGAATDGTRDERVRRPTTTSTRSCPVCRESSPREAPRCRRCGLDFTDPEAMELHEFTGSRSTLRKLPTPTDPDGVLVVGLRASFLRLLRPAFTVSDDLVLGAGETLEAARADLAGPGGLTPRPGATSPSLLLVDAESVAAGLDPRAARAQLGIPVVVYGPVEDVEGFELAARLGADTFVRQSASAILFVARVRLCLARLKRGHRGRAGEPGRRTPTPLVQ